MSDEANNDDAECAAPPPERSVQAWMRAAAYAEGAQPDDGLEAGDPALEEVHLDQAVEVKKRDNLALGEALVRIGLIGQGDFTQVQSAQQECDDLVGSLLVASAIRSRLGEILLRAKRISSSQLELALQLQRQQGGPLGEILVRLGWLDEATLDAALAAQAASRAA